MRVSTRMRLTHWRLMAINELKRPVPGQTPDLHWARDLYGYAGKTAKLLWQRPLAGADHGVCARWR